MITITENAKTKILDLMLEENDDQLALRAFVQGGGCAGFSYGFTFDSDQNEDDFVIMIDDRKVLIDSLSMQYMQGSSIDYQESLMGSEFKILNPNVQTTCGCGSSFSV